MEKHGGQTYTFDKTVEPRGDRAWEAWGKLGEGKLGGKLGVKSFLLTIRLRQAAELQYCDTTVLAVPFTSKMPTPVLGPPGKRYLVRPAQNWHIDNPDAFETLSVHPIQFGNSRRKKLGVFILDR